MQPNINAILVHNIYSFNLLAQRNKTYKKCSNPSCSICKLSLTLSYIDLNLNFILQINNNSSCDSQGNIYLIKCMKCNCFYIGETSRLISIRVKEHIADIKGFIAFEKRNTSVSKHFNLLNHSLENFKFTILFKDINDDSTRFNLEAKIIHLFKLYKMDIINETFPSIYTICFKDQTRQRFKFKNKIFFFSF